MGNRERSGYGGNGRSRGNLWDGIGRKTWHRRGTAAVLAALLLVHPLLAYGKEDGTDHTDAGQGEIRVEDQSQRYPLLGGYPEGDREDYIALSASSETAYEVKQGGTLWGIARQFYGSGGAWEQIAAANPDAVGKDALILTGAKLWVPQVFYVEKQAASLGGFSSPACSYDMPANWAYAYTDWEVCLESIYCREQPDSEVCVHITENRMFPDGVGDGWEEMQEQIQKSAQKAEGVVFSGLQFERYFREDGRELLYYSFVCGAGEEDIRFAVAYVVGKNYLAEFIGTCPLEEQGGKASSAHAIGEITRYMAASFTETDEEKTWSSLKYRPYLGYEDWAYEDLHNPFAMAAAAYAPAEEPVLEGRDEEITFVSKEWEDFIRMVTAYHYDMTDEEWEAFSERPVRTADVAWITEVSMMESPIPGRDTVAVEGLYPKNAECADYNLTTLEDIAVLPNLEKLELEIGSVSDYEVLGKCQSLRELTIVSAKPLTDVEWLAGIPGLESLALRISMFTHLNEMGYEKEGGSTFAKEGETTDASGKGDGAEKGKESGNDLEDTLGKCTSLKYLELEAGTDDVTDFGFLGQLPNLYAFRLCAPEDEGEDTPDRSGLFGEDDYPQVQCLVVDDEWLRNPE